MAGPDKNDKHEIIIVKRRSGGHDEGHHGGVWKIAFADFMTAMMAFFLVLWIVNSTSKETRSSIARYFNPVQLADTTAARKGLREAKDEFDASAARDGKETGGAPAASGPKSEGKGDDKSDGKGDGKSEAAGGAKPDPHAKAEAKAKVKAESKDKSDPKDKSDAKAEAKAKAEPAPGPAARRLRPDGEPLAIDRPARFDEAELARDPQGALTALAGEIGPPTATPDAPRPFADPFAPVTPKLAGRATAKEAQAARPPEAAQAGAQEGKAQEGKTQDGKAQDGKAQDGKAQEGKAQEGKGPDAPSDKALADELAAAAKKTFAGLDAPGLEVKRTPDGVLISLTDKESFEMFAVGSSEPHPRLVALMAKVAAALGKTPGEVVLRGHTDARPFRSGANDNWRLSAARAAMARQMLLKGGFDAARVARVEGLAERSPRRPDDPLAAENRRIEILVRDAAAPPGAGR